MGKSSTLIILPCGNESLHNPTRVTDDFRLIDPDKEWNINFEPDFSQIKVDTYWKIFMYSNEYLDPKLKEALPFYLLSFASDLIDIYSVYKIIRNPEQEDRVFICPRIFRSTVELKPNSLEPITVDNWRHTVMLDGWVKENG